MKKPVLLLTAVNTVALFALGAYAFLGQGPANTTTPAGAAQQIAGLEQRISVLEQREGIAPATGGVETGALPAAADDAPPASHGDDPAATPAAAEGAAGAEADDARPVTRAELNAAVKEQLAAQQKKQREEWGAKAKAAKKRKLALPKVARELNLTPQQEQDVRALYRELEGASMCKLFGIEADGLENLKKQLAQSEWDPDLKASLRETIAVNWTRQQAEFGVLYVQLDASLRKVLDAETLARFYRYDVQLAEPGYPDIEAMFFPEKKD